MGFGRVEDKEIQKNANDVIYTCIIYIDHKSLPKC